MKIVKLLLIFVCFVFLFLLVSFSISAIMTDNIQTGLYRLFGVTGAENSLNFLADFTMIVSFVVTLLIFFVYHLISRCRGSGGDYD